MENNKDYEELYGDSNSDEIVRKIFKTLKIIGIVFFLWMVTYSHFTFLEHKALKKDKLVTFVDMKFLNPNYLRYTFYDLIYDDSENIINLIPNKKIKIKNIEITKTNFLNKTSIILNENRPKENSDEVYFDAIPILTKNIEISVIYLDDGVVMTSNHVYKPYFEFGVYRIWSYYDMFIHSRPLPLLKIGEKE